MTPLLNFHTHCTLPPEEQTIGSQGLHPWDVTTLWKQQLAALPEAPLIGECGLDRLCATPYDLQLAAFEAQIAMSELQRRPLVLHCVHALDDVLRLHKGTLQPWIFHGFRGKPQQLSQLIDQGFYVSFGLRHNADSLKACPAGRLLLETDDKPLPIEPLYDAAATLRGVTKEALSRQTWKNLSLILNKNIHAIPS